MNRFILNYSQHPPKTKKAAFHSSVNKFLHTPLNEDSYKKELTYFRDTAVTMDTY